MHLQVYKEPLCRRYYASPCSLASVYWIGSMVTLLLAPFMMAYDPYKFWSKTDTYLEQPEVTYTKQLLLQAEGFKSDEAHCSLFSTVAGINDFSHVRLHGMAVKSFASDTNRDGLDDRLVLNVRLPLEADEEIYSIKMLVFFRTRLRDRARIEMDNLVYFEEGGYLPGGSLSVEGDLSLRQTWPLSVYGGYSYPYRDYPLLNPSSLTSARETLFSLLLARNAARNLTLGFEPQYSLWERASPHAFFEAGRFLNITAVFRIHQQSILYIPPVSEVLQVGWSKYVVMLFIVLLLVKALSGFIFRHQVVETKMVGPYVGIGAAGHTLATFSR